MRERKAYEPSLFSNSKYLTFFFSLLTGGGNGGGGGESNNNDGGGQGVMTTIWRIVKGRTKILRLGSKVIIVT